jgi:hypothetical protein
MKTYAPGTLLLALGALFTFVCPILLYDGWTSTFLCPLFLGLVCLPLGAVLVFLRALQGPPPQNEPAPAEPDDRGQPQIKS